MSSDNPRESAMVELLDRAERRIASLEARLAKIEDDGATSSGAVADRLALPATVSPAVTMREVSSRRGLFKVAGAVASAAVAHNLLSASPAAASTTGPYVGLNVVATTTTKTGVTMTPERVTLLRSRVQTWQPLGQRTVSKVCRITKSALASRDQVRRATESWATRVAAMRSTPTAAWVLDNTNSTKGSRPPGGSELGDIIRDIVGNMFVCVDAGSAAANATKMPQRSARSPGPQVPASCTSARSPGGPTTVEHRKSRVNVPPRAARACLSMGPFGPWTSASTFPEQANPSSPRCDRCHGHRRGVLVKRTGFSHSVPDRHRCSERIACLLGRGRWDANLDSGRRQA